MWFDRLHYEDKNKIALLWALSLSQDQSWGFWFLGVLGAAIGGLGGRFIK